MNIFVFYWTIVTFPPNYNELSYDITWGGMHVEDIPSLTDPTNYYSRHNSVYGYFLYSLAYYVQHHQEWGMRE